MRLVQGTPRRICIPQEVYKAPLSKRRQRRALRATPCTSPLVQRIGMSKQLLLVRVSVDRVGQRTTEHNRSSSPPDSRRLTEYNGVAKAKGWKISLLAENRALDSGEQGRLRPTPTRHWRDSTSSPRAPTKSGGPGPWRPRFNKPANPPSPRA